MEFTDLFNVEYVTGSLRDGNVSFFTDKIGYGGFFIISIVGFSMVILSIARVAIAALYFIGPNFWDKVNEAKRNKRLAERASSESGNRNAISRFIGGAGSVLTWFPNVRAALDDRDVVLSPVSFFTKAIPTMCIQVTFGVLIFYGYTANIGQWFARAATATIDLVLLNADPSAITALLPENFTIYSFMTDGSDVFEDQIVNDIAKEATKKYVSVRSDVVAERRQELASSIEDWVMGSVSQLDGIDAYLDENAYNYTCTVQVVQGEPDLTKINGKDNNSGGRNFAFSTNFNTFDVGSTDTDNSRYFKVTLSFQKIAEHSTAQTTVGELTLVVPYSAWIEDGNSVTIRLPQDTSSWSVYSRTTQIQASSFQPTAVKDFTITFTRSSSVENLEAITGINGLRYGSTKDYRVTAIKKGDNYGLETKDGVHFGIGEDPAEVIGQNKD